MGGNYAADNFTENDVMAELEGAGLRYRNGTRYILSQCPLHEDKNASAQIYKDDWFVKCHAGCEGGRFHITKAFPSLRDNRRTEGFLPTANRPHKAAPQVKYISVDLMNMWAAMDEIPEDHYFKGIPIEILNDLGWRYDAQHHRYFIPYFSRSKKTIPFGQWRNLGTGPRFNFWKDTKPTMYGTWNLEPGEPIFLVEGCSDAAVMDFCAVPWVAAPSAASGELVKAMALWCKENGIKIYYAGDNDAAGDKLKDALDDAGVSYRRCQPRTPYKDWGEMYEAEGIDSVSDYCMAALGIKPFQPPADTEAQKTLLEKVQDVFPGAVELKIVGGEKEQSKTQPTLL